MYSLGGSERLEDFYGGLHCLRENGGGVIRHKTECKGETMEN